jgi:glycosyltransferase involved in cell wall biosynthesis
MIRLIIVEPWFTAVGHPAQSVLNTARVLGMQEHVSYLISREARRADLEPFIRQLAALGSVFQFHVPRASLMVGTLLSVAALIRIARREQCNLDLFFLDASLPMLATLWPLLRVLAPGVRSVATLELAGPELCVSRRWSRLLVGRFLRSRSTRMFLRTEELAAAWRAAFAVDDQSRIDTLPSLEIPDAEESQPVATPEGPLRFGVLGQMRPGKGIEWLVPLFRAQPQLGDLQIAGSFYNEECRAQLSVLQGYSGFRNVFIPEAELLPLARSFDYILTMYDKWDHRFEAATFYLAARVQRPVICYDQGWCGRMMTEFGCGIGVAPGTRPGAEFFQSLPARNSSAYQRLIEGMKRFRTAHSGENVREEFMRKLTGDRLSS